ncbi:hypothetical protein [Lysobacter niastensis]|uniref:hypothetical protein n=1 Tax=Lysobacter niastensis TaxID=380629 RepID=UPI00286BB8AA|nr:hypothetical protein [Lysobacter niastensis]
MHGQFSPTSDRATVAAYFLYGLEAGLFPEDCAKDWAFSVIAALDDPPIEIIDVATAAHRQDVFGALANASLGADSALAGRWLLTRVHNELLSNRISVRDAIRKSMQVAFSTQLPEDVYYAFDALDDELQLAENGVYSTVADVTRDTLAELSVHGQGSSGAT